MLKVDLQENYIALQLGGDINSLTAYELLDGILTVSEEPESDIEAGLIIAKEANKNVVVVDALYEERAAFYEKLDTIALPTLTEATDYIYMQQLERELGE